MKDELFREVELLLSGAVLVSLEVGQAILLLFLSRAETYTIVIIPRSEYNHVLTLP